MSMQGYLKVKPNSFFSGYSLYYFVLSGEKLLRYKTNKDQTPTETIEMDPKIVSAIIDGESLSGKKNSISVFFNGKSPLVLLAATEAEHTAWMQKLQHTLQSAIVGSSEFERQHNDDAFLMSIEGFLDGCVVADVKCNIMGFNKAAEQLFGYTKQEIIGKNVTMLMPEVYTKAHEGYVNKYLKTGNKRLIGEPRQMIGRHKDQTTFPVQLMLGEAPKYKSGGSKCAFIAMFKGVDENSTRRISTMSQQSGLSPIPMSSYSANDNGEYLNFAEKKLLDRIGDIVETVKKTIHEEFEDIERNYIVAKHKLDILEMESKRIGYQSTSTDTELAELQAELAHLRKGSTNEKASLIEVLRKGSTYLNFLHYLHGKKYETNCAMFWKDAEDFRRKYSNRSNYDSMASAEDASAINLESQDIYKKYITPSSAEGAVPCTAGVKAYVEQVLLQPVPNMFLMIQDDALTTLLSHFREFCKTDAGKTSLKSAGLIK